MANRKGRLLLTFCFSSGQDPAQLPAFKRDFLQVLYEYFTEAISLFHQPVSLCMFTDHLGFRGKGKKNSLRSIVIIIIIKKGAMRTLQRQKPSHQCSTGLCRSDGTIFLHCIGIEEAQQICRHDIRTTSFVLRFWKWIWRCAPGLGGAAR